MGQFPFAFERINETTWAYLSSFLMIALFFKFNRFWSIRNLDLLLILLLAPGILMVSIGDTGTPSTASAPAATVGTEPELGESGENRDPLQADSAARLPAELPAELPEGEEPGEAPLELDGEATAISYVQLGYYWLFAIGGLFLIRMLGDTALVRRPVLESNLTIGGLVFLGCTLTVFLILNVLLSTPSPEDVSGVQSAVKMLQRETAGQADVDQLIQRGPGYTLFSLLPVIPSFSGDEILDADTSPNSDLQEYIVAAKLLAITSQFAIVMGLILFCSWHFHNFRTGVEAATIYLILPYTAIYMGHAIHALPAALMIWAAVYYKRPWIAGLLIGFATGVSYYPLFLLPLWISFYWERGKWPFVYGFLIALVLCAGGLLFTSDSFEQFRAQLQRMLGIFEPRMEGLGGIWALGWDQWYRLPLLAAFIAFSISFVFWPIRKNIGTLLACSAAIMVALQFWHGFGGGTYLAYYLPLALVVFLRPNVEGRTALVELPAPRTG